MKLLSRILHKHRGEGFIVFFFILFSVVGQAAPYHKEIRVPLGLAWGDSPEKLEGMARPGGFTITHRAESAGQTILTVHGLLGLLALQETLFVFQKNALVEIEYRYRDPVWNAQQYQDFFDSFRRMYDTKYEAGTQLIHMSSKKQDGITISLIGYQWSDASSILDLFYYTAEQSEEHIYRLISLHYKAP